MKAQRAVADIKSYTKTLFNAINRETAVATLTGAWRFAVHKARLVRNFAMSTATGIATKPRSKPMLQTLSLPKPDIAIFAYIVAAIGVPQLLLLINPQVGVYANAVALLLLGALAIRSEKARPLAISAGLLPVVTTVSLSLPQPNALMQSGVFYGALLLLALVYRHMFTLDQPQAKTALGWQKYVTLVPLFVVGGQVAAVVAYGLLGDLFPFSGQAPWSLIVAAVAVFAVAEEMFFRGLLQQRASTVIHPLLAVMLTASLYAAFTLPFGNAFITLLAFGVNALLSYAYFVKPNLVLTIAANTTFKLLFVGLFVTFG